MTVELAARAGVEGKEALAAMEGAGQQGAADNVPGAASDMHGSVLRTLPLEFDPHFDCFFCLHNSQ